jgi:hypothetical protein
VLEAPSQIWHYWEVVEPWWGLMGGLWDIGRMFSKRTEGPSSLFLSFTFQPWDEQVCTAMHFCHDEFPPHKARAMGPINHGWKLQTVSHNKPFLFIGWLSLLCDGVNESWLPEASTHEFGEDIIQTIRSLWLL